MMDDEMMTRLGKIGIEMIRKEMDEIGRQDYFFDWDDWEKKEDCRMKEMENKMEARGWA